MLARTKILAALGVACASCAGTSARPAPLAVTIESLKIEVKVTGDTPAEVDSDSMAEALRQAVSGCGASVSGTEASGLTIDFGSRCETRLGRLAGGIVVRFGREGGERYFRFTLDDVALGRRSAGGSVKVTVAPGAYRIEGPANLLVTFQKSPAPGAEPESYQERVRLAAGDPTLGALLRTPLLVVLLLLLL